MTLALAVMLVAKALTSFGERVGGVLLKKLVDGKEIDVETLMQQVD